MEQRAIIEDGLSRGRGVLRQVLEGLEPDALLFRAAPSANPIGWLAWHIARVEDMHVADLIGEEQLWTREGFHQAFGMEPDEEDYGTRHTPEQVAGIRPPSIDALRDYYSAVAARTDRYVASLTPEALDRVLDEPQWTPRPTVGVRLNSLIHHVAHHGAQAAYLRGLYEEQR